MATLMRAKVKLETVTINEWGQTVSMKPVTNGTPEDNTYSKYTPDGLIELSITNENLQGKFKPGQVFYVDFTPVE